MLAFPDAASSHFSRWAPFSELHSQITCLPLPLNRGRTSEYIASGCPGPGLLRTEAYSSPGPAAGLYATKVRCWNGVLSC